MSLINKIGDIYHKYIYRNLSAVTAKVNDRTDFCISDLILGPYLFVHEIAAAGVTYVVYIIATADASVPKKLGTVLLGTVIGVSIPTLTYFGNLMRTPLEKKLNLQPVMIDRKKEIEYTIRKINELSDSEPLDLVKVSELTNQAVDNFVEKIEGYRVKHTKKVKTSHFSKTFSANLGGFVNPLTHEVVVFDSRLEVIAHEKAHVIGYAKEYEAQVVGYISLIESGNPSLQYLAYMFRLFNLLDQKTFNNLSKLGLNLRSTKELDDHTKNLRENYLRLSHYRRIKIKIGEATRSLFYRVTGQGNLEEAYLGNRVTGLISAYDPPK